MRKTLFSALVLGSFAYAGGYKVPEQSADSLALLASNVAFSFGADAAYYNPANMMFLDPKYHVEGTLGWFHTGTLKFSRDDGKTHKSREFDSLAGTFSFVSSEIYENFKFGLALGVPAALGMGWKDPDTAFSAKRFKLQVVELNPSVAYRVNDNLAVAIGARAAYSKGIVANDYGAIGERELKGDSVDYGYNLALTYRALENLSLALTYRSKIDLSINGDAQAKFASGISYNGKVSVEIPLPAQLMIAGAYKFSDLTLLLAYERTYWSKFKGYDFEYSQKTPAHSSDPYFKELMDNPTIRKYRDTNTYRVGLTYDATQNLRLMAGFSYDQDVSKPNYTGLELPNTSAKAYSAGLNYKLNKATQLALGYVYQSRDKKRALNIPNSIASKMSGEFSKGAIQIVGATIKYDF